MQSRNMPAGSSASSGAKGMLIAGTLGMPLKPPSCASPMWYCGPAVELTTL